MKSSCEGVFTSLTISISSALTKLSITTASGLCGRSPTRPKAPAATIVPVVAKPFLLPTSDATLIAFLNTFFICIPLFCLCCRDCPFFLFLCFFLSVITLFNKSDISNNFVTLLYAHRINIYNYIYKKTHLI